MEIKKIIRDANINDLAAIVSIYNAAIPARLATADTQEVSIQSRLSWFHAHTQRRPLWVHENNSEITGWLSLQHFYGRPAYNATVEFSVYIKPTFHRQHIAKTLLRHAIESAPRLAINTILGFIFAHNRPSINLVTTLGFKEWGYLPKIAILDGLEKDLAIYGLRL